MPAPLVTSCPGCGKSIKYPERAVGKSIRCRYCGTVSKAPASSKPTDAPQDETSSHPSADATREEKRISRRPIPVAAPARPTPPSVASSPMPGRPAIGHQLGEAGSPVIISQPRLRRKFPVTLVVLTALGIIAICSAITGSVIAFVARHHHGTATGEAEPPRDPAALASRDTQPAASVVTGDYPRRILAIGVHNYIFANPTSYGFDASGLVKRDLGKTVEKLASRFRVPDSQVFELSDGAMEPRRRIPLKPVIEQSIQRFVETSRKQDRIILLLCAHTVEIEGVPYVVPLEGDLTDPKTLIPLEWILKQLASCRAQQKWLIADFNRYDRGRGVELPHGGKLAASTAQLLKNPPPGVQVWSACSEGEYSYEFDDYYEFRDGNRIQGIKGGVFLSMFSVVFMQGLGGKTQSPSDSLPIEDLAKKVNELTQRLSEELEDPEDNSESAPGKSSAEAGDGKPRSRVKQSPFISGSPATETVPYDPTEAVPPSLVIPTPREVFGERLASVNEVRQLVDFFLLPPIKEARKTASGIRFDEIFPFRKDLLDEYRNHMTAEQVRQQAAQYPVRAAVVHALEQIRGLESGEVALPATLTEADRSDSAKANFARMQRAPARVMNVLEELDQELERALEHRDAEKSKFWQLTFDYVRAQVKARHVYVNEYTNAFGIVRRDRLPALDPQKGHVGWRLASQETLSTNDNAMKERRKEVRKIYDSIIREHPDTPWAIVAKRERNIALGLRWEPYARPKSEQLETVADSR